MRLHQINDDDLKTLEECVPQLTERLAERTTNADRAMIRRVKEVLSNVRWNYQPHREHQIMTDEGDDDQPS